MRRIDFSDLRLILLDAIISKQPVQSLVDRVYACVNLPIICFDVMFRVVAHAFTRPFYYSHWENLVIKGYAPDDVVVSNNYLSYQQMMYELGKSQIFDWGTSNGYPQACGPVMLDKRLVGYVGLMIEDVFPEDCIEANDMLSQTISILLRGEYNMHGDDIENDFSTEQVLVADRLSTELSACFKQNYSPPYVYVVLSPSVPNVSKLQYILNTLTGNKNSVVGCLNGEKYICLVYYGINAPACFSELRVSMEKIALRHAMTVGVSDYFEDPLTLPSRRMQAMLTMSVGSESCPDLKVFLFRDYYSNIISYCAIEYFGASASLLPEITALAQEDTHSNSYIKTLELYLNSFHSHTVVARDMGLHKNTIINRMRRIQVIIGQNPDDCYVADKMLTGLNVYRILEQSGRLPVGRDT